MIDLADDHYALDITKAKQTIGWQPKHFVLNDLPVMISLLKNDPLMWYATNDLTPPEWLLKKAQEAKAMK